MLNIILSLVFLYPSLVNGRSNADKHFSSMSFIDTLEIPRPGERPDNEVPFSTIERVAYSWGRKLWGNVTKGPTIPYVDFGGGTIAYLFNFSIDESNFPDYETLARNWFSQQTAADLRSRRYGQVLVSSRYDRAPILMHSQAPAEYYIFGYEAKKMAAKHLSCENPILNTIYYLFPDYLYFEFRNQDKRAIVEIHGQVVFNDLDELKNAFGFGNDWQNSQGDPKSFRSDWDLLANGKSFTMDSTIVDRYSERAPFYLWSYSCVPTSASMVLGYWDSHPSYGKLVDYYFRRRNTDVGSFRTVFHVPNLEQEIAIAMGTDTLGGTGTQMDSVLPGLTRVANQINGYNFVCELHTGSINNDYCWQIIVNEINANFPILFNYWWCSTGNGHANAVFGYREQPIRQIFRHNTWYSVGDWYIYWDGNPSTRTWWWTVHPGGGGSQNISILTPHGDRSYYYDGNGEYITAGQPYWITWDNKGNSSGTVNILFSTDGGKRWSNLASCSNTGEYRWFVPDDVFLDSCRIQVKLLNPGEIASDGSYGNFVIHRLGPWSMYRNNYYHSGRSGYIGPTTPRLWWSFPTGSVIESSPAIGEDGTIYVGSNDNNLHAINLDGSPKWSYNCGVDWFSSPAVDENSIIYIGGGSSLYALYPNGSLKWEKPLAGRVVASPTVGKDGTIYACTGDNQGKVYAINPDSTTRWECSLNEFIYSSPALSPNDSVLVGCLDGKLYCIYNGMVRWTYATGNMIHGSPLIHKYDYIYNDALRRSYEIFVTSLDGYLYRLNMQGAELGKQYVGGEIYSSPALAWDNIKCGLWIYVTSTDSCLHAVNHTFIKSWKYKTAGPIRSSPAVDANGVIYFSSGDGYLYAINPDGSLKWRFQIGNSSYLNYSSPAIGLDKTIYLGYASHNNLLAINDEGTPILENCELRAKSMGFSLYPCPTSGRVNFNIQTFTQAKVSLNIYDIQGRLVKAMTVGCTPGANTIIWDGLDSEGGALANGVYFCVLGTREQKITEKIIVIK